MREGEVDGRRWIGREMEERRVSGKGRRKEVKEINAKRLRVRGEGKRDI